MKQRFGIAQALIGKPKVIIVDEPTAGLDPIGCREVKDVILALARRGKTVILTSHLLSDVEDVCDRVVIYYGGKIQAQGTLNELLARPDSIRITTPVLSREVMEKVLAIIRSEVASDKVRVDNPTQNLESYFLEVVERARQSSSKTSGATSGNKVAAYLQGGFSSEAQPTNKVLERLIASAPSQAPAVAVATPADEEAKKAAVEKLAALTKQGHSTPTLVVNKTPETPSATTTPPQGPSAEEVAKANQKLSSFLNKPKS